MKNTKWIDVRVGDKIFTVKCHRNWEECLGMHVRIKVFAQHPFPVKWYQKLFESFKYPLYRTAGWYEKLSDVSLTEFIDCECGLEALTQDSYQNTINEWENL